MDQVKKMRPRIGITMDVGVPDEGRKTLELPADYAEQVFRAGGMAVLLPFTHDAGIREEMIEALDGLLVPGGDDLDPRLYGQAKHAATKVADKDRQDFDLAMLALAEARRMPTLGICMGCQTMNVQRRGTLHQHLPEAGAGGGDTERGRQGAGMTNDQLPMTHQIPNSKGEMIEGANREIRAPGGEGHRRDADATVVDATGDVTIVHRRKGDRSNAHGVAVRVGTRLAAALGAEQVEANSRHHQGIDRVGHGLVPTARAPDGLVEAVEDPSLPFWVAVQWHPENLRGTAHEGLFGALVAAAGEYREGRGG